METVADFQEWHKKTLEEFINGSFPDPNGLREIAARLEILPLMLDWGGCYALRSNGQVITFLWDEANDVRVENDLRICNIALFQGSKKYSELKALIPPKPNSALKCHVCGGTGVVPISIESGIDNLVCYCGGLGWVPSELADLSSTENSK